MSLKQLYAKKVYEIIMDINDNHDYVTDDVVSDLLREAWNLSMVVLRESRDKLPHAGQANPLPHALDRRGTREFK